MARLPTMPTKPKPPEPRAPRKRGPETQAALVRAALDEFNQHGFDGTDTNRIARRAGFAPQTFYRWFEDKAAVFIAAYELWAREEASEITRLIDARASDLELTRMCAAHHRRYRLFRRSLRLLSLSDPRVRAARAASRTAQIAMLAGLSGAPPDALAIQLLTMERLADALAEDELADLGLPASTGEAALAKVIGALRSTGK